MRSGARRREGPYSALRVRPWARRGEARWHGSPAPFNGPPAINEWSGLAGCLTPHGIHAAFEAINQRKNASNVARIREDADMRRFVPAAVWLALAVASPAVAQDPVAERAVTAAKEFVKAKGLKEPKLTILLSSLYNNSFPDFAKKWEELTGVKFEIVPLGYT